LINHGIALHSIRACPRSWLREIAAYSKANHLPLHVHVSEQARELELCQQAYGMSPIALLETENVLGEHTTLVHGTHVSEQDIHIIADTNTIVCICPSTERNLGDGMAPIEQFLKKKVRLTIGTDSHARMDIVDEMRSLEDHERLRLEKRLVWARNQKSMFENMIPVVCSNGYASLGVPKNSSDAVFVKIPRYLKDCTPLHVAENWLIGGSGHDVTDVLINNQWVLKDSKSPQLNEEDLFKKVNIFLKKITLS